MPNINTPTTLEVPQLQPNGAGQAIQVPANGGTIVNIGNVPIQVGPTSNPADPNFTTLSIGTSMPWPNGQACWAFVQEQWASVGLIQVQPVQSSYAPGSPGILPITFTQLPANWNVSNAIPPGCTGIMIVVSTLPSPNPQFIVKAQSPISNNPADVTGPQIIWSGDTRLIAGTPLFIPFNSTLVEYLQLENVNSQPFVGLLAFALYGNDVVPPSLGQNGGTPPGSVTVIGGEVLNTGTLNPDHTEPLRVDSYGEPFTVPIAPPTVAGDHPLTEIEYFSWVGIAASQVILPAPGAGTRYRIFFAKLWTLGAVGATVVGLEGFIGGNPVLLAATTNDVANEVDGSVFPLTGLANGVNSEVFLNFFAGNSPTSGTIGFTTEIV